MPRTFIAIAATAALVLATCAGSSGATSSAAEIRITQSDFKFAPARLSAPAGVPITLTLKNVGGVEHDFAIEVLEVKLLVRAGREDQLTLGPLGTGTYTFVCTVPGHKELGMVGTLTVK